MSLPAARVSDFHACPLVNLVVPHVGGPILPPGEPTVLIGDLPAATVSAQAACAGPPDVVLPPGAPTVLIGGLPAARATDMTSHGGSIVVGCFSVLVGSAGGGESGGGQAPSPPSTSRPESCARAARRAGAAFIAAG